MKKMFLECGKIVTTHGLLGEVKVQPWCDGVEELVALDAVYFDGGEKRIAVQSARAHKGMGLLKLEGFDTVDEATTLRGRVIFAHRDAFPLEQGEYFIQDLIGLSVLDADSGQPYGTLCEVTQTGANDVYHILFADGVQRLIPVIPQVVIETDLEGGFMKIRPLKGLFDDAD